MIGQVYQFVVNFIFLDFILLEKNRLNNEDFNGFQLSNRLLWGCIPFAETPEK